MRAGAWIGVVAALAVGLLGCSRDKLTQVDPHPGSTDPHGGSTGGGGVDAGPVIPPVQQPYARTAAPNPIPAENAKPGDGDWYIQKSSPNHEIEAYADPVGAEAGESVDIHVSVSAAADYSYAVYRMGYYGGLGARKVATGGPLHGQPGAACPRDPATSLVECDWPASFQVKVGADWVSGVYLVKLHRADGYERYVHFVVRDHRAAEVLLKNALNTYQAYNAWGGEGLYNDRSGTMPNGRAYVSAYDRPYDDGEGTRDYWWWERHLARWMEMNGYDVTYGTTVDVARFKGFFDGIGAIVTGGHDEYWTQEERDATDAALASGKTSLVHLGANGGYWRVRLEPDAHGHPYRRVVCFKNEQDKDPALKLGAAPTARFRDEPRPEPENALFGAMYENWMLSGFPLVFTDTSGPLFRGTGLHPGDVIPRLLGYEYDKLVDNGAQPAGLQVLADSPLLNAEGFPSRAQVTARTTPQGRLVFSAGTIYWPRAFADEEPDTRIWKLTWNVLETALAHRRPARPLPAWPDKLRVDGATVPAWAQNVSTVAGEAGRAGYVNGPVATARFASPTGLAVAADGTMYVSESTLQRIRVIKGGAVSTLAGTGDLGLVDGPGLQAMFRAPEGLALGPDGALYVADSDNHRIRRIALDGRNMVTTFAGTAMGYADGPAASAAFNRPEALAFGPDGTLYVADTANSLIRTIGTDPAHTVRTLAGTWVGYQDGPALQAAFDYPTGLAVGADGALYVLDSGNHRLRRITLGANPVVETLVGSTEGFADGTGDQALILGQGGLLCTNWGLLISDAGNHRLRVVQPGVDAAHTTVATLAGSGQPVATSGCRGDQAGLAAPAGLALGADGTVYVADTGSYTIRAVKH